MVQSLFLLGRGMPACGDPLFSDHYGNSVVQPQGDNGGSSSWSSPHDSCSIRDPTKMVFPLLKSRIKQRNFLSRQRIERFHLIALEIVAKPAGQPKIFFFVCSPFGGWNEVFDFQPPKNQAPR